MHATTWPKLKGTMLNESSQTQKYNSIDINSRTYKLYYYDENGKSTHLFL